tara:strand:- start:4426 stop:4743 length:318 start_codon:yes stop_codon:yes gene_type:complete
MDIILIETFKYQVTLWYSMLDPIHIESIIESVFDNEGIVIDILFTGIDLQPNGEHTAYVYNFTIIYADSLDRVNIEYHMDKIQELVKITDLVDEPCDIVLDLTVG